MKKRIPIRLTIGLLFAITCGGLLSAVTLDQLEGDAALTPKRFAKNFRDFRYAFHPKVQPVAVFLSSKAGDCDDYATLADRVLRPKGYTTRLITVRMPGSFAHVVCYVTQEKGYLDYNNRAYLIRIERSGPSLREVADKVAKSFSANWTTAAEFTFQENSLNRLIRTVAKTDSPKDKNGREVSKQIEIDF